MLASGPVEQAQGFESTWGRVLAFFFLRLFFAYTKIYTIFFRFSDLVICGFLVWSDSVCIAHFYTVPHVLLYISAINSVLFTAVGRQISGFEPSLRCFCAFCRFVLCSFFRLVMGVYYCCCSYSSIFHSIPKMYLFLASHVTKNVAYLFFLTASLSPKIPSKIQVTSVQP